MANLGVSCFWCDWKAEMRPLYPMRRSSFWTKGGSVQEESEVINAFGLIQKGVCGASG